MFEKGEFETQNIRIIAINIMVENQMMLFRMHNSMTSTSHESSFRVSSAVKMLSAVDYVRARVYVGVFACVFDGWGYATCCRCISPHGTRFAQKLNTV